MYEHRVVVTEAIDCVNFMVCINQRVDAIKVTALKGVTLCNVRSAFAIGYTR
jgi:hypothetical protein